MIGFGIALHGLKPDSFLLIKRTLSLRTIDTTTNITAAGKL